MGPPYAFRNSPCFVLITVFGDLNTVCIVNADIICLSFAFKPRFIWTILFCLKSRNVSIDITSLLERMIKVPDLGIIYLFMLNGETV